jgi:hypothetical protein
VSRQWAWRAGFLAAVLLTGGALLAGPYQFLLGTATGSTAQPARVAPCLPGQAVDIMDSPHIAQSAADNVTYHTTPATSGPHFAFTAATGTYQRPVPEGLTVHALEHGHVAIQYAPGTGQRQVEQLARLARRYPADVILAPHPALDQGIALTAWGQLEHLESYDEPRITRFVEALRGRYQHGWTTDPDCPPRHGSSSIQPRMSSAVSVSTSSGWSAARCASIWSITTSSVSPRAV